jgi:hypothetical protein
VRDEAIRAACFSRLAVLAAQLLYPYGAGSIDLDRAH